MSPLKDYRVKAGISQNDLAVAVGVSQRYIAFLENGERNPSLEIARKISDYFKTSIEEIFLPNECTNSTQNEKPTNKEAIKGGETSIGVKAKKEK